MAAETTTPVIECTCAPATPFGETDPFCAKHGGPDVPKELLAKARAGMTAAYEGDDLAVTELLDLRAAIAAVLPAHEAMVREQVAKDVEAWRCEQDAKFCGSCACRKDYARIARGGNR